MNSTNRAANRLFLLVTGLLLIAAGVVAGLLALLPAFASGWRQQSAAIATSGPSWVTTAAVGTVSWLAIGVAAVAVVLVILLIVFIARQGRGHADTVVERQGGEHGRTRVDLAVPRTLLSEHLDENPDILSNRVTAYDVRGTATLKVSVRARRGVSPRVVMDEVLASLHALDTVLGEQLPAYIQISGGFRARTASRARVA